MGIRIASRGSVGSYIFSSVLRITYVRNASEVGWRHKGARLCLAKAGFAAVHEPKTLASAELTVQDVEPSRLEITGEFRALYTFALLAVGACIERRSSSENRQGGDCILSPAKFSMTSPAELAAHPSRCVDRRIAWRTRADQDELRHRKDDHTYIEQ